MPVGKKWKRREGHRCAHDDGLDFPSYAYFHTYCFSIPQVVAKLHAILRPFLLRRLKADVEQMLPRKKEIILYAAMTAHQRNFQDHLINKTLEGHLREKSQFGNYYYNVTELSIIHC